MRFYGSGFFSHFSTSYQGKLLRWRPGAVTLVYPLGMKPCGYGQMVCLERTYIKIAFYTIPVIAQVVKF